MNDPELCRDTPQTSGGCQCGAVTYAVTAGPTKATVCHCRMCQRAIGAPFAALLEVPRDRVTFTGPLKTFASSAQAERGFCANCGTSLSFGFHASSSIEVTAASLDANFPYAPVRQHGVESKCKWLETLPNLPSVETFSRDITSNQSNPENDGA